MRNSKRVSILVGGTAILMGVGVAFAFWTSTGNGTGSATTGTSSAWEVTTDGAVGAALTPGGATQDVTFHVKNNNSGVQRLNSVTVTVAGPGGAVWDGPGTCSAADYNVLQHTVPPASDVAAGATYSGTVTIQMVDTGSNQDDCKAASVPLYVSAN
jgi:hypothetical protein